jgi:AraC-like DNA-binding protein
MSTTIWVLAAVCLVLAVGAGWMLADNLRRRRDIDTLMARLEAVENRLAFGELEPSIIDVDEAEGACNGTVETEYSADVLAGRTSHIARLVSESARPSDLADQAVMMIYRRIEDPIRPADLADALYVSLRTLERGIARTLDCTPTQLILTVKMREARRLIESGGLRVSEVAHRLAFADSAHLSRRYRRFYRCPPSQHAGESAAAN